MDVIERYLDEVLVANETTNLTRIVSRESAEILHVEDSMGLMSIWALAGDSLGCRLQ